MRRAECGGEHSSPALGTINKIKKTNSIIKRGNIRNFSSLWEFYISVDEIFIKITMYPNFVILENETSTDNKMNMEDLERFLLLFIQKVREGI